MTIQSEFSACFSPQKLEDLYRAHLVLSGAIGHDRHNHQSFGKELSAQIDIISRKAIAGTYTFTKFRQKLISKGARRSPREISIPTIRDRLALRALNQFLTARFSADAPLSMPQVVIHRAFQSYSSGSFDAYIKLDVAEFYPSIKHKKLLPKLNKRLRSFPPAIALITAAISTSTVAKPSPRDLASTCGVPQGLSISNILAAIFLKSIDDAFRKMPNLCYFRYVDDVLILCKQSDADSIIKTAIRKFRGLGLKIHDPKKPDSKSSTGLIGQPFGFLGYHFDGPRITVRSPSVERLRESLLATMTSFNHAKNKNPGFLLWRLNLRITGCIFEQKAKGWMFFFSEINDEGLLHQLDDFISKMLARFGIKGITPKRFVRAFYEIKHRKFESNYIPNFDTIDINGMKQILTQFFGVDLDEKGDAEITQIFQRRVKRETRDLQEDLGAMS